MKLKQLLLPTLLLLLLLISIIPSTGHGWDQSVFKGWADYIKQFGVGNAYYGGGDLPPLYYYILQLYNLIFTQDNAESFNSHIKIFTLLFDLTGVLLVLASLTNKDNLFLHWALLSLNIAFLYNSIIWGQIDGIASTLNFACILFAYRKNWPVAISLFVLCINFKIQSIVFLPLFFVLLVSDIHNFTSRKTSTTILAGISVQLIVLIPFLHPGKLKQISDMLSNSVGHYAFVSLNAANIWYWLFPVSINVSTVSDQAMNLGMTLRAWGLAMMCMFMLVVFYPSLRLAYLRITKRTSEEFSFNTIMLTAALIPLTFFFFNTEMHERYTQNAWLFIAAWSFNNKKYLPFVLFSVCHFLNLEAVLKAFHQQELFFWSYRFIAFLFAILISFLITQLYSERKIQKSLA